MGVDDYKFLQGIILVMTSVDIVNIRLNSMSDLLYTQDNIILTKKLNVNMKTHGCHVQFQYNKPFFHNFFLSFCVPVYIFSISVSCLVVSNSYDPVDCGPSGSSVHGILPARMLDWDTISFCSGFSQPRDQTWVSYTGSRFSTI